MQAWQPRFLTPIAPEAGEQNPTNVERERKDRVNDWPVVSRPSPQKIGVHIEVIAGPLQFLLDILVRPTFERRPTSLAVSAFLAPRNR